MLEGLLNAVASCREWADRDVVVLSAQDAEKVRHRLTIGLSPEASRLQVTVCYGRRTSEEELLTCHVDRASLIFIIGEDGEDGHDALNVECWEMARALRANATQVAQCYLYLNTDAAVNLFHMLPQEAHTSIETTIVNPQQSLVQQLLGSDNPQLTPHTLDRGLVTAGADRYVHLVVVGMTTMGQAFATTAARLCHFPNFDASSQHPLRTRITFIDPAVDVGMNRFRSSLPALFALSHSRYMADETGWLQGRPDSRYGDFLDVEWEFVKGSTDDEWVRAMLATCAADPQQVLSVAFCNDSADENLAQAFHLPLQLYPGYVDDQLSEHDDNGTCIYVYQPQGGALIKAAQTEVMRYRNLIPFGEHLGDYDPLLSRQTAVAKRVNYLYQKENSGKEFVAMPTDAAILDDLWQQLPMTEKMSCVHVAASVYAQLRSLGLQTSATLVPSTDTEVIEALARTEQARRNIEKLLLGFGVMTAGERTRLNAALESEDPEVRQEARTYTNRNTNQLFLLKDIAPYDTLPEASKADIRTIVCNLPLAALPYISRVES